jgi:ribose transport system ATP-binding protein
LCLASLEKHFAGGRLSAASEREVTAHAIERLDVRPPDPARRLGELSGGNQQKIVLGKWLELDLQVLILDEPTYGVDVGARRTILRAVLERVKERDLAVLLLDSDIDLVAGYADRVLVMRRGRITSELVGSDITVDQIAAASYAVQDTPTA